jgi:hypothetical protein
MSLLNFLLLKMLKNLWTSHNSEIAYSGITKIKDFYKNGMKNKEIESELSKIRTYTRHKEAKKIKKFNPFFVYSPHEMWQIDLMYLPDLARYNEGYKYLLCLLEVFSRKLYIKLLKEKTSKIVTEAFIELQKVINFFPDKIVCDMGGEFKCKLFKDYCKENNINLIFTKNDTKAAHVERAQRSFQGILYRILEEKQTKKYIDHLKDTLYIYNRRKNRITGFPPNDAIKPENIDNVLSNLNKYYKISIDSKRKPKYKIGDLVRILEKRSKFARGYQPYFSEEVFKIKNILTNLPQPRYVLSDFDNQEEIIGSFYEAEITKSEHEEFKIEKIIKKRKYKGINQFYVKWAGFSSEHNSWVDEKDIVKF